MLSMLSKALARSIFCGVLASGVLRGQSVGTNLVSCELPDQDAALRQRRGGEQGLLLAGHLLADMSARRILGRFVLGNTRDNRRLHHRLHLGQCFT